MTYSIREALRRKPLCLPYYPKEKEPEPVVMLTYPFPLGPKGKVVCQLVLPRDLPMHEAQRICALVMALATQDGSH